MKGLDIMRVVFIIGLLFILTPLFGCASIGSGSKVTVTECPEIGEVEFPIKEFPERPVINEEVEPWYHKAREAYLTAVDAADGYKEILRRSNRGEE